MPAGLHLSVRQIVGISLALITTPTALALAPRTEIDDEYDFVIVGGGQAGLVLGGRLAEDTNHTVLVLESGDNGDAYRNRIDTPAYGYFDSLWNTPLDWAFDTEPQSNVKDRKIHWPRGKTLGGSSAINGLYLTRPGEIEIDAWKDMLGDMDGADNWSWDSFYAAIKKSETFTPPSDDIASEAGIEWNKSERGKSGPIQASYPGYTFPQVGQWSKSLESIGIHPTGNMYGGENWGGDVATSTINPSNWTRSYSRTGYLDPMADHGNYDVLANAHVTRILFDDDSDKDDLVANEVEYTTDGGTTKKKVKVRREVVLAAGTVGSPAVLMHSGVGPKDVLSDADIDLVSELPGVGQHLQDHLSATVKWNTNAKTAGSIFYDNDPEKADPLFLSYIDSAIAYVNASHIYGDKMDDVQSDILDSMDKYEPKDTYEDTVIDGFKAIYDTTVSKIFNSSIGQVELLFMNSDGDGKIGITAAIQHPFSHGRIYVKSSDPMENPIIDPNYLSNPADYKTLIDGLKLARKLGETTPLGDSLTGEAEPGTSVQSDDDWLDWALENVSTEFHPSSTCAMLPRDQGGVVDAELRVYGLKNVRVADASVPPISLSTHLMSSTYGLAEQASTIIREYNNKPNKSKPKPTSVNSSSEPASASESSSSDDNGDDDDDDDDTSAASAHGLVGCSWAFGFILAAHVAAGVYF